MSDRSTCSTDLVGRFEAIQAAHPDLGFAFYGYEPGGLVIFEVITPDGQTFQFQDVSFSAAIDQAFPPDTPPHANDSSIFD